MSWGFSNFSPVVDLRLEMWLWFHPLIIELWKNLEFRSPSLSHPILDFCLHRVSSCWAMAFISFRMRISYSTLSHVLPPRIMSSCSLSMSCSSWLCALNMSSNTSLFQILMHCLMYLSFCWNWYILVPMDGMNWCHQEVRLGRNSRWFIQNCTSLKGFGLNEAMLS